MANINPNYQASNWAVYSKVARNGLIGSSLLIAVSAVALVVLYAMNPSTFFAAANYINLVTLSTVCGLSFVAFVISLAIRCRACHRNIEIPDLSAPIPDPVPPPTVVPPPIVQASPPPLPPAHPEAQPVEGADGFVEVQAPVSPPEVVNVDQLKQEIPGLMDEAKKLLQSFAAAYYRAEGKPIKFEQEINEGIEILKKLVSDLLDDKQTLMNFAILAGIKATLDETKLEPALKKTPAEFLQALPTLIIPKAPVGLTHVYNAVTAALSGLAANANLPKDAKFIALYKTLQTTYAAQELARGKIKPADLKSYQAFIEKEDEFKSAGTVLFNYLLSHFTIEKAQLENWSQDVIPEYLSYAKGKIFSNLTTYLGVILNGHAKGGFFNAQSALITLATTFNDRALGVVEEKLEKYSLGAKIQFGIMNAVKKLLPALSNPFFYAVLSPTFGRDSLMKAATQKVFQTLEESRPEFTAVKTWPEYLKEYKKFLQKFTAEFDQLFPAKK